MLRSYLPYLFSLGIAVTVNYFSFRDGSTVAALGEKNDVEEQFLNSEVMIIASRNAPSTYFIDKAGKESGFEFELASEFAKALGKRPVFKIFDTTEEIMKALKSGKVHMAAAGIARTPKRQANFAFGPDYHSTQVYVICHRSQAVRQLSDLIGKKLVLSADSSYVDLLIENRKELVALEWQTFYELSTEEILSRINERQLGYDCSIADANIFDLNRHLLQELRINITLGEADLAWPVAKESEFLVRRMETWFHYAFSSNLVKRLYEKHFGMTFQYDVYDLHVFRRRIRDRLPQYEALIREAALKSSLPFSLLAAVAYQESHWDPNSVSPTGVRGFMMLTMPTANALGVTNRVDVRQSLMGGARYLRSLIDRFPEFIPEEDRIWFGLAAYNVGYYHLQDARRLAVDMRKNPHSWQDIQSILPLLANEKYYKKLRYGYARGHEPVVYVRNIRRYQKVLEEYMEQRSRAQAAAH